MDYGIDDASLHYNLGLSFLKLSRLDESKKEFQRAVQIEPNMAEAYNNLGYLNEAMDNFDAAIAMYKKALAVRPDYKTARENMERLVEAPVIVPERPRISKRELMRKLFFEVDTKWGFSRDVEIETPNGKAETTSVAKRALFRIGYLPTERIDLFLDLGFSDYGFDDSVQFPSAGLNVDFNIKSGRSLSNLNDGLDFTFDEIADLIELVYVHRALD